jgi:FlaG/FlaF family flagellin (archaellin)
MPKNYKPLATGNADYGVSEVIGAILLISVVITAVAIIGVLLLSQTTPQAVPHVNFMTGTDNSNRLYLFHNGGDSLTIGCFSVLVDGVVQNNNNIAIAGGGNTWSLGQNLVISGVPSSSQHSIVLAYNTTGGGAAVVGSGSANALISVTPIINPDVITATYPPVVSIPQLMENVSDGSVVYYRQSNNTILQSANTYLKFNVTSTGSTIYTNPACGSSSLLPLIPNDTVIIYQGDSVIQGFTIAGIGNQIWELSADNVLLTVIRPGTTLCTNAPLTINYTKITGYNKFQTNFSIATLASPLTGTNVITGLTIYNSTTLSAYTAANNIGFQVVDGPSSSTASITNISPMSNGFFMFQFTNTTRSIYFAGNATAVTYNGVSIPV